jgi:type IV pilus assembly protein PilV
MNLQLDTPVGCMATGALGRLFKGEGGISLIEVMVTVVVVSFGLLGIAAMLFSSINAGQVSMQRSVAVMLANEMADRIRSNSLAIQAGSFDAVLATDHAGTSACSTTCMTAQCGATDQATLDVCLWKKQIGKQLPGGTGSIANTSNLGCVAKGIPCIFTISVIWNETAYRAASATSATNQTFQTSPSIYSLSVQP